MNKIIAYFLIAMCVQMSPLFAQEEKPVIINTWYEIDLELPLNLPIKSSFLNGLGAYYKGYIFMLVTN